MYSTVALVTGASSGLGRATALGLARRGAAVVMVSQDPVRGAAAREAIQRETGNANVVLLPTDLASLGAVRGLAAEFRRRHERLDVLVNNAGVYLSRCHITADGFEKTLAVNHLSHFLLTNLLLGELAVAGGRVITVSSDTHRVARLSRSPLESILRGEGWYNGLQAYADSKLANILFTFVLARRLEGKGVTVNAMHPGIIATRIWDRNRDPLSLIMRLMKPFRPSARRGAKAVVHLALDPGVRGVTGRYFHRGRERRAARAAYDQDLAEQLWQVSARLTGLTAPA